MGYQIRFTENNNSNKKAIVVNDKSINTQTSLNLVGNNYPNYASYIGGDLLHILENFANPTSPPNPVQGQLWYDNVNNQLMVNSDATETNWISAGSVIKSASQPTSATSGDLWVDNIKQQLYLYTGVAWILVGPQYSQDTLTGQIIETLYDNTDNVRGIISIYSENNRIAIISSETFTPKLAIPGFSVVNAGFTLINSDNPELPGQTLSDHRYYGTATDSERLGGKLASSYILATSTLVTFNGALKALNVSVGSDRNLYIGDDSSSENYLISTTASPSKLLEVRMNSNPIIVFSPNGRVGIATRNPETALDVNGTTTTNKLIVDNATDVTYTGAQTASTQLSGGLYVEKSVLLGTGGNITIPSGTITVANTDTNIVLTPKITNSYDIGTIEKSFRNIYSQTFYGNIEGNVIGNLSGNVSGDVSGNAGSLKTSATFNLLGDITSNSLTYNGTQSSMNFSVSLNGTAISSKPELTKSLTAPISIVPATAWTDQMLICRSRTATFSGYIIGTSLHVKTVFTGVITVDSTINGIGILPGTKIVSGSNTLWVVDTTQTIGSDLVPVSITSTSQSPTSATFTGYIIGTSLHITSVLSGVITVGSTINGNGVLTGTRIVSGSGTLWVVNNYQSTGSLQSPVTITETSDLYRTTKQTFLSDVPLIKPGTILLYPNEVPEGYLKCDGSIYYQSHYPDLFRALGSESASYVDSGKFTLPNIPAPSSGNMIVLNYIIFTGIL